MMKNARRASILMEYVILLMGMIALVEGVALATWNFQASGSGSFGSLAQPVVQLYQRIVAMISLPFP